jgi:hypothetical protein
MWRLTADDSDVGEDATAGAILHDDVNPLPPFMNFMFLPRVDQLGEEQELDGPNDQVVIAGGVLVSRRDRGKRRHESGRNRRFIDRIDLGSDIAALDLSKVLAIPGQHIRVFPERTRRGIASKKGTGA